MSYTGLVCRCYIRHMCHVAARFGVFVDLDHDKLILNMVIQFAFYC